jgi:DNA polymerase III delta subunit
VRADLAEESDQAALLDLACPSLFGGRRTALVDHIELAHPDHLAGLAGSDLLLVARTHGQLPKPVKAALEQLDATFHRCATPRGRDLPAAVTELADHHGITLQRASRQLLVDRSGHDLARIDSILRGLAAAGLTTPSVRQTEVLLGSQAAPGVPWDLSDAAERGDTAAVLQSARTVDPLAACGWMTARAIQLATIVEADWQTPSDIKSGLGLRHEFQAKQLGAAARRLDGRQARQLVVLWVDTDRRIKTGGAGHHHLELALARTAALFGQRS